MKRALGGQMNDFITFLGGCVIGGLLSWIIAHGYYVRGAAAQATAQQHLAEDLRPRNTIRDFEVLLETSTWTKTFIDRVEIWNADADNTFQIERGDGPLEFTERWTTGFPNPKSWADPVYLKIGGTVIEELTFISMDGARIFVPIAKARRTLNDDVEHFWNLNSLPVKVCRIIGRYYAYNDLEGVARACKVTLID